MPTSRALPIRDIQSPPHSRFLSEADCHDIAQRLAHYAKGGGETAVHIVSRWSGNVRWARNRIITTGEDRDNRVGIKREINGARTWIDNFKINEVHNAALVALVRRAERMLQTNDVEKFDADMTTRPESPFVYQAESASGIPQLFYDSTYQLDAEQRADAARELMQDAATAGMFSAGYVGVSATSFAYITSWGYARYYQYTWAQYSTTVRDPKGIGSGWAGADWPDWNRIEGKALSKIALEKCLQSRNPVTVEPGRYTTILEPQAVCDFTTGLLSALARQGNEMGVTGQEPFHLSGNTEPPYGTARARGRSPLALARFGERVIDERLTLSADPIDPEVSFPPYAMNQTEANDEQVYHPAAWIEHGVLKNLSYSRDYAIERLGKDTGLPNSGAFRMSVSGDMSSLDEMIATTKRGLLVTRFDQVQSLGSKALLCRGYTRDGLWLIENGKFSKPVKNMLFVESILSALNNIEQIGVPRRTFHPTLGGVDVWYNNPSPVFVPALKIRDFSFTALSDAV